uniref:Transglutaminase N-terminal domain-containing protein n=1 Tax=Myripristis murdjan TaxID=586833 RepID=A0A667WI67_9TELE
EEIVRIFFKKIDFQSHTNNTDHHTNEITTDQLVVRRGQHFVIILDLLQPFNPDSDELIFTASTGTARFILPVLHPKHTHRWFPSNL